MHLYIEMYDKSKSAKKELKKLKSGKYKDTKLTELTKKFTPIDQ